MAQFTNQAQLSYNNAVVNSNVAVGEVLDVLSATKTAVADTYAVGDNVAYVISIVNSGSAPFTGISVSDDLGTYTFNNTTLTPLTYVPGSIRLYVNGALQEAPAVTEGPPLIVSNLTIPANSSAVLVYEASVNRFAPLGMNSIIRNSAIVNGVGVNSTVTATDDLRVSDVPNLTITKNIDPVPVNENGILRYTFTIQNYGNSEASAAAQTALTDTFNPSLSGVTVTFNGAPWTLNTNYTYTESTGAFATIPGQITVPAASYTQDPDTGNWVVTPGVSTLTVTGTV